MKARRALLLALPCTAMVLGPPSSALAGQAAPAITHAPRVPFPLSSLSGRVKNTWAASNWSGYAETGTFTGVTATWTVPGVSATSSATYSAAWIGIDGFNDSNLIQTGTEQDYYGGSAHYDAWWEILPAAETEISPSSYPVSPGDRMSASIYKTTTSSGGGFFRRRGTIWVITIQDTTRGWSFTTDQSYSGAGTSAEWILEAPEVNGGQATLADYVINPPSNTGDFDSAGVLTQAVSSGSPSYSSAALNYANDSGVMVQNGAQVSTPGNPDAVKTAFNIAYGASVPGTPMG